jgi:spermidine dehydrogenase
MSAAEDRDLGMDRSIPRRDFLNGLALGIVGACAAASAPTLAAAARSVQTPSRSAPGTDAGATEYPPSRAGLRGQYPSAVEDFVPLRDGAFTRAHTTAVDTGEEYDLVIVGGGISGLTAAYFWRRALPGQRVLILDNHDDFGGHAKRNEFSHEGRTFIGYGGTMGIATPYPYSYTAKALVAELGVQVERNNEFFNRALFDTYHLGPSTFFDKEHFGEDKLVRRGGKWEQFFAAAPLSADARRDLIRLHGTNPDYMSGMTVEQKLAKLDRISYQEYLLKVAHISADALPFFLGQGGRNNKRVDTTPALEAARHGSPGFDGLGLDLHEAFREGSYTFHFPDGNASIARLLVRSMIPAAIPGHSMEDVVTAHANYSLLDQDGAPVRIRLNSTVVHVAHIGANDSSKEVQVDYMRDQKLASVRAKNCVLACYNGMIPYLCPDLPDKQKEALSYLVKAPLVYTHVAIKNWTGFQKLGIHQIEAPGSYHTYAALDFPVSLGEYKFPSKPDEPMVLFMLRTPCKPGLPLRDQHRAGRAELLRTSFSTFELNIRDQLGRMLGPTGFDPARDIDGITVNRWAHGYAYGYNSLFDPDWSEEEKPWVIGRKPFGRITIANSDAGASAYTDCAIDQAYRAVNELGKA